MSVTAADIAKLRAQTGAGMLDCKKALDESAGDMEKAIIWLRERGIAKAAKRAGKIAAEGTVYSYIHAGGKVGVLVEVNSETDFVAKNDMFQELVKDIGLHIAAAAPKYVSREEVPTDFLEKEKDVYRGQMSAQGGSASGGQEKSPELIEKIVEGKVDKFYSDICLLEQPFIKDDSMTIEQLLTKITGEIGEKISVRRFARYELGEGIEKESKSFVDEVKEQIA